MTWADTMVYGKVTDPEYSKVADRVDIAPAPVGPHGLDPTSWVGSLGWAIPKNIPEQNKKVLKEMLPVVLSTEAQIRVWKETGVPPVTYEVRKNLKATDPLFRKFVKASFEAPVVVQSAYYYPEWSEVQAVWCEYVIKAIIGPEVKIQGTMQKLTEKIHGIMKK